MTTHGTTKALVLVVALLVSVPVLVVYYIPVDQVGIDEVTGQDNIDHTVVKNSTQQHVVCDQTQRQEAIKSYCASNPSTGMEDIIPALHVLDEYKLIYCPICKSGSTSFTTLLGRLATGNQNYSLWTLDYRQTGVRFFKDLSPEEQQRVLKEYYKIVVIRHPLDRLRSAYISKVIRKNHKLKHRGEDLIREYMMNLTQLSEAEIWNTRDIFKLEHFMDLVSKNSADFQNVHWTDYWKSCNPCGIQYDLIIKLETMDVDLSHLYAYLKSVQPDVELPQQMHENNRFQEAEVKKLNVLSDMLRDFDPGIMSRTLNHVSVDMGWAGYRWDSTRGATCQMTGQLCC